MTSYFDFDVPATCSEYNSHADYQPSQPFYQPSQPSSSDNGRWRQNQDSPWVTAGLENALAAPTEELKLKLEEESSPVLLHAPIPRPAPIDYDPYSYAQILADPGTEETLLTTPFPTFPTPGVMMLSNAQVPIDYDPYGHIFANDSYTQFLANSGTETETSLTTTFPTFPTPSEMLSNAPAQCMEPASPSDPATKTVRLRAHLHAMAGSIGYTPTNPDSITAHEKKRHYLECLEEYVLYLHEQIKLADFQPIPLERVPTYQGLCSRSIRTILVHMQNEARELNLDVIAEEKRFLTLRDTLLQQQAAEDSDASDQQQPA